MEFNFIINALLKISLFIRNYEMLNFQSLQIGFTSVKKEKMLDH